MVYRIGKNDIVLILGNSAAMGLNIYLLFLKAEYSRKPPKADAIWYIPFDYWLNR
jgi:hypothetical protein